MPPERFPRSRPRLLPGRGIRLAYLKGGSIDHGSGSRHSARRTIQARDRRHKVRGASATAFRRLPSFGVIRILPGRRPLSSGYHSPVVAAPPRLASAVKTYVATPSNRERDWVLVDASGKTLGRLATQIADMLRGKRKPEYTPHIDTGDFVVVVNAEKIAVTGDKRQHKLYRRHSGYPGGLRTRTLDEMLERRPEEVIRHRGQGDAAPQPARPPAAAQAEGVRGARPSARGADSRSRSRS